MVSMRMEVGVEAFERGSKRVDEKNRLATKGEIRQVWIVSLPANMDFMIFNHRYQVSPVETVAKLSH
ncbi:hypothetical protein ACSQ67_014683 [Phaseolus vulgaris]